MLRNLCRWLGYLTLASAFGMGIVDGARSIASQTAEFTPLGSAALWAFPRQFPLLEPAVTRYIHPGLWDPLLLNVLLTPAVALFFGLGALLLILGRSQPRTAIGS